MPKRTIIIGDIHGCAEELSQLLALAKVTAEDRVISAGDVFDKGPDSVAALRVLRAFGAELCLGNHEEKILRWVGHEQRIAALKAANPKQTPPSNPMKGGLGRYQPYIDALTPEEVEYLGTAQVYIPLPEYGALVIHAGVLPGIDKLPSPVAATLAGKDKETAGRLIRVRYVSPEGKMVKLGEETPADTFWAESYDGRFGHIYFGHDPVLSGEARRFPHATGLDTGCVFGGHLTAAVLASGGRRSYFSVAAGQKYAEPRNDASEP